MTDSPPHRHASRNLHIYSKACLGASPTYWKWVKLTAADVHALRTEPSFQEKGIFFHLNHPVHYVYLCGTVVAVQVFARFLLVTLDDGSGETIEIRIGMLLAPMAEQARTSEQVAPTVNEEGSDSEPEENNSSSRAPILPILEPVPTTVENVEVLQRRLGGVCYETILQISGEQVDVGAVIVAKGTLNRYQEVFQIQLLRATLVKDVGQELRIWREYAEFVRRVLCKPWKLSSEQVKQLEGEEQARDAADRERQDKIASRKREAEAKLSAKRMHWSQRVKRDEQRRECERRREEQELNGNALDKAHVTASRHSL